VRLTEPRKVFAEISAASLELSFERSANQSLSANCQ
jgi:hypothetical protein